MQIFGNIPLRQATKRHCHASNLPSTEQATTDQPKKISFFLIFHRF